MYMKIQCMRIIIYVKLGLTNGTNKNQRFLPYKLSKAVFNNDLKAGTIFLKIEVKAPFLNFT